jgi:CubicO group peptidase (beta-lactamase class C family)
MLMAGGAAGAEAADPPAQRWGLGFQLYPNGGESGYSFGHTGLRGFFAAADPDAGVAVAVTVNRLTASLGPTRAMLSLVAEETGFRAGRMTGKE